MTGPTERETNTVVVPFGVPNDGRGLGLGLAALVHGLVRCKGEHPALAQIVGKRSDEPDAAPGPVEAFIPPQAWRDLAGQGNAPGDVRIVVTGAFEPPGDVAGSLRIIAFDARDGVQHAMSEVHIDAERAGAAIVDGVEQLLARIGGEVGELAALRELSWAALESVLRAERCALHDPTRGGPHDRLAAMMHLGRAIEEAPDARYPAARLAAIALDAALGPRSDPKLAEAAVRAITRAVADAPAQLDLIEATAALHVRMGNAIEGEATALAGLARDPKRARLYVLLSEARRARGDLEAARSAVADGIARAPYEGALFVERGIVLAESGDALGAQLAWRDVLGREPLNPAAFSHLAALAGKQGDATGAQSLVDLALAGSAAHPEVLRCALHLVHAAEPEGIARDTRIVSLARALLARTPEDAGAAVALGHALARLNETRAAIEAFTRAEALAPRSAAAAEAQRVRFALAEPMVALEVEAVARAAKVATDDALESLGVRARRLAADHATWTPWVALGVIERRRGAYASARDALLSALAACEGCASAHRELARTYIALNDARPAVEHALRAVALEGESAASLGVLAESLAHAGRRTEADQAIARALSLTPDDPELRAIADAMRVEEKRPSVIDQLKSALRRAR